MFLACSPLLHAKVRVHLPDIASLWRCESNLYEGRRLGVRIALMMGNLYDALRAANVPDDKAQRAAEEVAGFETQIGDLKSDMKLLKWMVGAILALQIAQFVQTLL